MPRSTRHPILFVLLAGLSLLLGGCSDEVVVDDHDGWTAEQFYKEARGLMNDGAYEKAAKTYEKLESRFPFGKYATQSQLDVAYCYYKNDEPDAAIAAGQLFYPMHWSDAFASPARACSENISGCTMPSDRRRMEWAAPSRRKAAPKSGVSASSAIELAVKPIISHAVEIWRANVRAAVATQVAVAEIVGQDDDDVWRGRGEEPWKTQETRKQKAM